MHPGQWLRLPDSHKKQPRPILETRPLKKLLIVLYTHLVQTIARLEAKYLGNATRSPHMVPGHAARFIMDRDNVQYFAVDSSQACQSGKLTNNLDAPVVVAIGANYSQGAKKLPDSSPSKQVDVWAYVEDVELRKMRGFLDTYFHLYRSGILDRVWTTEESHQIERFPDFDRKTSPIENADAELPGTAPTTPAPTEEGMSGNPPPQRPYHLVATNFSPWITTVPWSAVRNKFPAQAHAILDCPPHGSRTSVELDDLKELLPSDTIWIGHGNHDVYVLFRGLMSRWGYARWFFRKNLAFPLH